MFRQAAVLLSVFLVKRCLIPISSDQDVRHPVRCTAHDGCDGFYRYILAAFYDQLIMDVAADEAVGEVLHCEAEKIPADRLYDILYEFRTVGFNAFPFLCGSDAHVGNGFAAECIFADPGFHVGEKPAGRKLDEKHSAFIQELNATDFCADPLLDGCLDGSV